ncbi:MAG: hypothetical protein PVI97_12025 [Candidatus Thiodiazotropha sp.]|jgi:hypothetical protein
MKDSNHFLNWLVITCLLTLATVAVFNLLIDPYNIHRIVVINGFNTSKPATTNRTGLAKTYMVNTISDIHTLILGQSRLDISLNPKSNNIPSSLKPVFNMAVPGARLYQQYRYLQHADADHEIETILLGIEFESFLVAKEEPSTDYPGHASGDFERRLAVDYAGNKNPKKALQYAKDAYISLISNTALADSFRTIWAGDQRWIYPTGLSNGTSRFGREIANKGHYSVFRDTLRNHIDSLHNKHYTENSHSYLALRDIMEYCQNHGKRLVLLISPAHVYQYEIWSLFGLDASMDHWKYRLTKMVDSYRKTGLDIVLWDYATYNVYSTEPVPSFGNKRKMQYYWEPVHFKISLGNIMMGEMFSGTGGVGTRLEPVNICSHLAAAKQDRATYRTESPQQLAQLHGMIGKSLGEPPMNQSKQYNDCQHTIE